MHKTRNLFITVKQKQTSEILQNNTYREKLFRDEEDERVGFEYWTREEYPPKLRLIRKFSITFVVQQWLENALP